MTETGLPLHFSTWMGIALCVSQSAILSGLNLADLTVSKLELRIEVAKNNRHANRVLTLREDANFLLVTILWGNVLVDVLPVLLCDSILSGAAARESRAKARTGATLRTLPLFTGNWKRSSFPFMMETGNASFI